VWSFREGVSEGVVWLQVGLCATDEDVVDGDVDCIVESALVLPLLLFLLLLAE